ncbi:MAG: hypothetical protein GY866_35355 [Proteobacteria bacterium]|nr:hypothetical protein [Pseudomonadota bacterium]
MKAIKIAIVMILVLNGAFSLYGWLSKEEPQPREQYSQALPEPEIAAAEGLELSSLTALSKEIRSGQELERRLNEKDGINNLDLNNDKKTDYINVREFGDVKDKIGYSLTVEPVKSEVQEIATVTVERNVDRAEIQVVGNEQIYGDQAIFNDWTPIEREQQPAQQTGKHAAPMYSSYFYPRPLWISPWYFGFYPPYFSFFPVVHRSVYISRTGGYNASSVRRGGNAYQKTSNKQIRNPNQGKTAGRGITRSLKKPTSTQKKFQATQKKNLRSGGFGRTGTGRSKMTGKSSSTSGSRYSRSSNRLGSSRSSSFSSQRSSRSFGSSSFRSSGSRSRSFSFGK